MDTPIKILIIQTDIGELQVHASCEIMPIAISVGDINRDIYLNDIGYDQIECGFHWDAKNSDFNIVQEQIVQNRIKEIETEKNRLNETIATLSEKKKAFEEYLEGWNWELNKIIANRDKK